MMHRRRRALVRLRVPALSLLLLAHRAAHAQQAETPDRYQLAASMAHVAPLTLDEVLSSVDRSYPLLRTAEQERDLARAAELSSNGGFDYTWRTRATVIPIGYYESTRVESMLEKPTSLWGASAFAGYRLGRGEFAVYDWGLQTLRYGELRAGVNVPLWRNGPIDQRRAERTKAQIGVEVAGFSITQQRIEFRRQASQRYWAWVAAGMRLSIARALLENVIERDRGLTIRVQRGDLADIERMDNARAMQQRKAQVAAAERGLRQAEIELSLFVRDARGEPLRPPAERLPQRLPEPSVVPESEVGLKADVELARARRPEAKRFAKQQEQSAVDLELAKNQMAPGIDLQLAGSKDFGPPLPSRPDLAPPIAYASLILDVPLQVRAAQGRRDAAQASLVRAKQQRAFAEDRIEADVRTARAAVQAARVRIEAARSEVQLAVALERAERTRFEQGDSHLLIVNLREQQTAEAELREVDAVFDYHAAHADLKAAVGG